MSYKFDKELNETIEVFKKLFNIEYPQYWVDFYRDYNVKNNRYDFHLNIYEKPIKGLESMIATSSYTKEAFLEEIGETSPFSIMKWLMYKVDDLLNNPKKLDI